MPRKELVSKKERSNSQLTKVALYLQEVAGLGPHDTPKDFGPVEPNPFPKYNYPNIVQGGQNLDKRCTLPAY